MVVGRHGELSERSLRLGPVAANVILVDNVAEHGLDLVDRGVRRDGARSPHTRHPRAAVPHREQRLGVLQRRIRRVVLLVRSSPQRLLHKGDREHVVGDRARDEVAQQPRRARHVQREVRHLLDERLEPTSNLRRRERRAIERRDHTRDRLALLRASLDGDAHAAFDHFVSQRQVHVALAQSARHLAHIRRLQVLGHERLDVLLHHVERHGQRLGGRSNGGAFAQPLRGIGEDRVGDGDGLRSELDVERRRLEDESRREAAVQRRVREEVREHLVGGWRVEHEVGRRLQKRDERVEDLLRGDDATDVERGYEDCNHLALAVRALEREDNRAAHELVVLPRHPQLLELADHLHHVSRVEVLEDEDVHLRLELLEGRGWLGI
mmetsp:Transcript_16949/g.43811  ORF Transcript_16949/g.43811 Transcript_16949/m.43811 type:complete len:380 (+) Transcript_16949:816-1955(+)